MAGSYIAGIGRNQLLLMPETIDDYISEDNPIKLFDSFVNSLDLAKLGFCLKEGPGRPSYDPGDMLKLYLWGYFNGIRSSIKLENECHRNLEAMWLINRLTPDFKTIADFRKGNLELIKRVFAEFNIFLEKLGLFKSHEVAIDGTKVKAANSMDRSYTREYLKLSIDRVSKLIEKYLKEMNENDKKEKQEIDRSRVQEAVKKLNEKKEKLVGLQDKIKESGMTEISLADPEAGQMKTRHGVDVCYNCHIAVEAGKHFITDYTVDNGTKITGRLSHWQRNR